MKTSMIFLTLTVAIASAAIPAAIGQTTHQVSDFVGNTADVTNCVAHEFGHRYSVSLVFQATGNGQADASGGFEDAEDGCNSETGLTEYGTGTANVPDATNTGPGGCVDNALTAASTDGSIYVSCVNFDAQTGDGDPESGFGGGYFPAGDCNSNAHHAHTSGTPYYAENDVLTAILDVYYTVGTDGSVGPITALRCVGDNTVTNDPVTGPNDCGDGATGKNSAIPATIKANGPGPVMPDGADTNCNPASGGVAGFVVVGPVYTNTCGTNPIVATHATATVDNVVNDPNPGPHDVVTPEVFSGQVTCYSTTTATGASVPIAGYFSDDASYF
jgi:hypothetical protein